MASTSAGWLLFAVKRAWTAPPSDFFAVSLSTLSCIVLLNPLSPATLVSACPDVRSSVPTNKDASQMVLRWSIVTWHVGNVTGEYGYGSALTMFAYPQSCI